MRKLFDETHTYGENDRRRTIWYQLDELEDGLDFAFSARDEYGVSFLLPSDYKLLSRKVLGAVLESEADEEAKGVTETHYILYTSRQDGDAIGDKVRLTLMVRKRREDIACDAQYGDFLFASAYDQLTSLKETVADAVRRGLGHKGKA